jgi:hypothetical protein
VEQAQLHRPGQPGQCEGERLRLATYGSEAGAAQQGEEPFQHVLGLDTGQKALHAWGLPDNRGQGRVRIIEAAQKLVAIARRGGQGRQHLAECAGVLDQVQQTPFQGAEDDELILGRQDPQDRVQPGGVGDQDFEMAAKLTKDRVQVVSWHRVEKNCQLVGGADLEGVTVERHRHASPRHLLPYRSWPQKRKRHDWSPGSLSSFACVLRNRRSHPPPPY